MASLEKENIDFFPAALLTCELLAYLSPPVGDLLVIPHRDTVSSERSHKLSLVLRQGEVKRPLEVSASRLASDGHFQWPSDLSAVGLVPGSRTDFYSFSTRSTRDLQV